MCIDWRMPLHISCHLTVGAVYEYNNETWVWNMSINAERLIHIPLSPPTDWLSLAIPRRLCSHHPYPSSLPYQMFSFSLSPLSHFLFPHIFHQSSLFFIPLRYNPPRIKKKESVSLILFISPPIFHLHILISCARSFFLCPLLYLPVTASCYEMAGICGCRVPFSFFPPCC